MAAPHATPSPPGSFHVTPRSCEPNVGLSHVTGDRSPVLVTRADVAAGEELHICYCDVEQVGVARRADLAHYGFYCRCKRCVEEEEEAAGGGDAAAASPA
jgi:hypothetical protein